MHHCGLVEIALHVVESEADIMTELDARQFADARLLTDPGFRDAEMFREFFSVQQPGKFIALDLDGALGDEPPEDLGFERLERRCALCDLFDDIGNLLVCEALGAVWMRDQVICGDFGWVGHRPASALR